MSGSIPPPPHEPIVTYIGPTIHERMVAILSELPPIGKNQKNQQQGFMFRGHDDVMNALNPLLAKHGVIVLPSVMGRETAQRTTSKGGTLFEVSLLVEFTFYGAGGDSITARVWGEGTDSGDKATSKAHTMAFKTALNQAFAVSNAEISDPDRETAPESSKPAAQSPAGTHQAGPAAEEAPGPAAPSPADLKALYKLVEAKGGDVKKTMTSAETATEAGKLAVWFDGALQYWQKQPDSFANKVPAGAKAA